jgi:hypothetical protein
MFILLHIKETPANFDGILQTRLYIIQTRAAVIEIHADLPVPLPMKKPPLCPFGNRVWNRCIAVGSRQIKNDQGSCSNAKKFQRKAGSTQTSGCIEPEAIPVSCRQVVSPAVRITNDALLAAVSAFGSAVTWL